MNCKFQNLLKPLNESPGGERLAQIARQIKIEKFLLAEIMVNGNMEHSDLDFYLEEKRMDLTIRKREEDRPVGRLVEWIEAKMCHSAGLARKLTGHSNEFEYRDLLLADVQKQKTGLPRIQYPSSVVVLTSLLFVFHDEKPLRRSKYRSSYRGRTPQEIEDYAIAHVHDVIAPAIGRDINEEFCIKESLKNPVNWRQVQS